MSVLATMTLRVKSFELNNFDVSWTLGTIDSNCSDEKYRSGCLKR